MPVVCVPFAQCTRAPQVVIPDPDTGRPRGAPELVYARDGRPLALPIEADLDDLPVAQLPAR